MSDVEPSRLVRFPPLTCVVGLTGAPGQVVSLLSDRWMAEETTDGDGAFDLEWSSLDEPCHPTGGEPSPVQWHPTHHGGSLRNAGGRIVIESDPRAARVELLSGASSRPHLLEPLVEAALGYALAASGACFLHAASIELHGRRPLLIGESGSGKSTVAAAAAAFGGRVISDDSLLLAEIDGRPLARAARRSLWLRPSSESLGPALTAAGLQTEQALDGRLRIARTPKAFRDSSHPDSLIVLRRDREARPVHGRPLDQAAALAALLRGTSTIFVTGALPADRRRPLLDLLATFAERLPAAEVAIGPALLDSPEECLAALTRALP